MPSLRVVRSVKNSQESTFYHFYLTIASDLKSQHLLPIFTKWLFGLVVINCMICIINNDIWDNLYYNYPDYYMKHKLNYPWLATNILNQFISFTFLFYVFFNRYWQYSLRKLFLLSFAINLLLFGAICVVLAIEYRQSIENTNNSDEDTSTVDILYATTICNIPSMHKINKECYLDFSLHLIYFYVIYQPIGLLFMFIGGHIMYYHCDGLEAQKKRAKLTLMRAKSHDYVQNLLGNELGAGGSSNNYSGDFDFDIDFESVHSKSKSKSKNNNDSLDSGYDHFLRIGIIFSFVWFIFLVLIFWVNDVMYYITLDLEGQNGLFWYLASLLLVTSGFKFLFKKLGRKIDSITMNRFEALKQMIDATFIDHISFEILMELTIDLVYYNSYYFGFIAELASDNHSHESDFIQGILIHVASEMCQSTFRYSKSYFDITRRIFNKFHNIYNIPRGGDGYSNSNSKYNYNDINNNNNFINNNSNSNSNSSNNSSRGNTMGIAETDINSPTFNYTARDSGRMIVPAVPGKELQMQDKINKNKIQNQHLIIKQAGDLAKQKQKQQQQQNKDENKTKLGMQTIAEDESNGNENGNENENGKNCACYSYSWKTFKKVRRRCLVWFVVSFLRDDSTFREWQIRHSIDTSMRLLAMITMFVLVLTESILLGKHYFDVDISKPKVVIYFSISISIDLFYFIGVFVLNWYCHNIIWQPFNIYQPILSLFDANKNAMLLLTALAMSLGVTIAQ